nr:MAG TPA: hypothetical protein [Caudoviricetes sp.]
MPLFNIKNPDYKPGAVREFSSKRRQVFQRICYHLSIKITNIKKSYEITS